MNRFWGLGRAGPGWAGLVFLPLVNFVGRQATYYIMLISWLMLMPCSDHCSYYAHDIYATHMVCYTMPCHATHIIYMRVYMFIITIAPPSPSLHFLIFLLYHSPYWPIAHSIWHILYSVYIISHISYLVNVNVKKI